MTGHCCSLWKSLLNDSSNRRRIYNDFMVDKMAIIEHLNYCQECRKMIIDVLPPDTSPPDFSSMDDEQFAKTIRELRRLSRRKEITIRLLSTNGIKAP